MMVMLRLVGLSSPTILHPSTENQRRVSSNGDALLALILPVIVHKDNVEGMEMPWDIPIIHSARVHVRQKVEMITWCFLTRGK